MPPRHVTDRHDYCQSNAARRIVRGPDVFAKDVDDVRASQRHRIAERCRMSSKLLHAAVLVFSASIIGCEGPEPVGPRVTPARSLADRSVPTIIRFAENVQFTIPAGTCGLTTTVAGTGAIEFVIQSVEHPDGTFTASQIISGTHGTAVGQDGSRYAFNHQNNAHVTDKTGG